MRTLSEVSGLGTRVDAVRATFPDVLPPAFAEMLACAIALEEQDGSPRAQTLRRHYLELMPAQRAAQLAAPGLLQARLDWARLPRLSGAIDRLYALLERPGAADELRARSPTLAALYERTYYGAFMPLLYGYPADLAFVARQLEHADESAVIDRFLTAPILHELTHLGRERRALQPIYLDECVAGWLGVQVLPEFAFPAPGEDNALFATPWFAQVGQALARVVGPRALVRAHAGVVAWEDVLPPGFLDAALVIGWDDYRVHRAPHFLAENFHPEPWLKLAFGARGRSRAELAREPWPVVAEDPLDAEILDHALRAMCLDNRQVDLAFRVAPRLPTAIDIDLAACRVTAAGGVHDPAQLAYLFPPAVAARLQAGGITGFTGHIGDLDEIPRLVSVIMAGDEWHASSSSIRPRRSR